MASHFPASWLEDLRDKSDIVQVIGRYVKLKGTGYRYTGLCPFHNETAPSFFVDAQKQLYYCFGCKAGGSVINFIMDVEHLEFKDAVKYLAESIHMPLPEMKNDPDYELRRNKQEQIYSANKAAAHIYYKLLWQEECLNQLNYLKQRGLSDTIIRTFGLGASSIGNPIKSELTKQGFSEEILIDAGLLMKKNDHVFDTFRNRIMFPIIDAFGHVLGFGGRAMGNAMPKYLNTADTLAFNKRRNVYGANFLRKTRNLKRILLVEGYMDVVSLMQYNLSGIAATLGTALTTEQARLMNRYAPEIYIAYDGDEAGQKAIERAIKIFHEQHIPVKVLMIPENLDPDEYIRKYGRDSFNAIKPISSTNFSLKRCKENYDLSSEDSRIAYAKEAAKIIATIPDPVEIEACINHLKIDTSFSREVLLKQISVAAPEVRKKLVSNEIKNEKRQKREDAVSNKNSELEQAEQTLLSVIATGQLPHDIVQPSLFTNQKLREVAELLLNGYSASSILEKQIEPDAKQYIAKVFTLNTSTNDEILMKMAQDCVGKIKKVKLDNELVQIQKELQSMPPNERKQATQRAASIMAQIRNL